MIEVDRLLDLVADLLNYILRLDPNLSTHVQPLLGHGICVDLTDLNLQVSVSFNDNGISLETLRPDVNSDLTIRGSSLALVSFVVSQDLSLAKQANLKFLGDLETANQVQKFVQALNIDWEEHLSKYLGDVTSVALCKFARSSKDKFAKALTDVLQMFVEYLIEESKQVPHRVELEDFAKQVDEIVARSNRLESRYEKLAQAINK